MYTCIYTHTALGFFFLMQGVMALINSAASSAKRMLNFFIFPHFFMQGVMALIDGAASSAKCMLNPKRIDGVIYRGLA